MLQSWPSRVFSKHFNGSDKGCEKDAEKEVTRRQISAQSMQELSLTRQRDGTGYQNRETHLLVVLQAQTGQKIGFRHHTRRLDEMLVKVCPTLSFHGSFSQQHYYLRSFDNLPLALYRQEITLNLRRNYRIFTLVNCTLVKSSVNLRMCPGLVSALDFCTRSLTRVYMHTFMLCVAIQHTYGKHTAQHTVFLSNCRSQAISES